MTDKHEHTSVQIILDNAAIENIFREVGWLKFFQEDSRYWCVDETKKNHPTFVE